MRNLPLLAIVPFALFAAFVDVSLHVYLYRRLVRDLTASVRLRRAGQALFAALASLMIAGFASRAFAGTVLLWLGRVGFLWFALAFYLFVCLLAADLVRALWRLARRARTGPADPGRRAFLSRAASASAAAGAALGVTGFGIFEAFGAPEVTLLKVALPGLPRSLAGLSIVQLTDLHVGAWVDRGFVEDLVERTNALSPDVVAITGDLVDGGVDELWPKISPLGGLRARLGTFFITGNHEFYCGADEWCAALTKLGIVSLRNERVRLGDAAASIDLVGVEDWSARARGFGGGSDLAAALKGRDPTRPAILLAHQPRGVEEAARQGIGLQLSGHTHGGQIWPWSLAVKLAFPYFRGRYQVGGMTVYVSRGCGFWGPPVRVGAPPEIVKVVLG